MGSRAVRAGTLGAALLIFLAACTLPFTDREARAEFGFRIQGAHYADLVDRLGEPRSKTQDELGGLTLTWDLKDAGKAGADANRTLTVWAGPDGIVYRWRSVGERRP